MSVDTNEVLARLILSTKRKQRPYSLFDIANDIKTLQKIEGNLETVASQVGISAGMLNQFLSIFKLPPSVIDLVKNRRIDSVSVIHNLSKFNKDDVEKLSELIVGSEISSQDLKVLSPYRKQFPNEPIADLVRKVKGSKDVKVSVIRIPKQDFQKLEDQFMNSIIEIIGEDNFVGLVNSNQYIDLKVTKKGEELLRAKSKAKNKTLQETISELY